MSIKDEDLFLLSPEELENLFDNNLQIIEYKENQMEIGFRVGVGSVSFKVDVLGGDNGNLEDINMKPIYTTTILRFESYVNKEAKRLTNELFEANNL